MAFFVIEEKVTDYDSGIDNSDDNAKLNAKSMVVNSSDDEIWSQKGQELWRGWRQVCQQWLSVYYGNSPIPYTSTNFTLFLIFFTNARPTVLHTLKEDFIYVDALVIVLILISCNVWELIDYIFLSVYKTSYEFCLISSLKKKIVYAFHSAHGWQVWLVWQSSGLFI